MSTLDSVVRYIGSSPCMHETNNRTERGKYLERRKFIPDLVGIPVNAVPQLKLEKRLISTTPPPTTSRNTHLITNSLIPISHIYTLALPNPLNLITPNSPLLVTRILDTSPKLERSSIGVLSVGGVDAEIAHGERAISGGLDEGVEFVTGGAGNVDYWGAVVLGGDADAAAVFAGTGELDLSAAVRELVYI